jgi:hypothetical protein
MLGRAEPEAVVAALKTIGGPDADNTSAQDEF